MEKIKETYNLNTTIYSDGFKCGVVEMYDRFAKMAYGKTFDHYDCTKICVGKKIFDRIEAYYTEQGMDRADFGMLWCCYGPKATLNDYLVELEDGWATDDEEN